MIYNHISKNAKTIKISLVEPDICWFEVLYHENKEIEKIAVILCRRKSETRYRNNEASVVKFCYVKRSLDGNSRRSYICIKNVCFCFFPLILYDSQLSQKYDLGLVLCRWVDGSPLLSTIY